MTEMQAINAFKEKLILNKPLLGIDFGTSKIGLSISDSKQIFALPHTVIKNDKSTKEYLLRLIKERDICAIVVGYPLEKTGDSGEACHKVEKFIHKISINLPIFYQDERFSTKAANALLQNTSWNRKKKNQLDDALSASNILQTTLDLLKSI